MKQIYRKIAQFSYTKNSETLRIHGGLTKFFEENICSSYETEKLIKNITFAKILKFPKILRLVPTMIHLN